jgi:hypothetical protein
MNYLFNVVILISSSLYRKNYFYTTLSSVIAVGCYKNFIGIRLFVIDFRLTSMACLSLMRGGQVLLKIPKGADRKSYILMKTEK